MKKLLKGIVVSALVILLPVIGNAAAFRLAHLWILTGIGILASMLQPSYNPFKIVAQTKDRWTGAQIIWSVYLTQLAAVIEAVYFRYPQSLQWNLISIAALFFALSGLVLRTRSVQTLGSLFTMHIDIRKNHTIISKGPYRFLRHPSYLGALVMYLMTITFLHSWFSLIAAIIILPIAFIRRIHYEEKLLLKRFGNEYSIYCRKTKKILPGIW